MAVELKRYTPEDENRLFALLEREGEERKDYWQGENRAKYRNVLASCVTYLIFEDEKLCGYIRCQDDFGFGIYIYDLLVDKNHRGKEYGRLLMERICRDYPENTVYVMGDVYPYYEDKLGYEVEGKIYIVKRKDSE